MSKKGVGDETYLVFGWRMQSRCNLASNFPLLFLLFDLFFVKYINKFRMETLANYTNCTLYEGLTEEF